MLQQSRFLALVSNKDLLQANLRVAEESEDTGTLQALKALDSIESKLNQVQVAYQQFYTNLGAESVWKTLLDGTKNFINSLNSLPKAFGKIPLGAATVVADAVSIIRTVGLRGISLIAKDFLNNMKTSINPAEVESTGKELGEAFTKGLKDGSLNNATLKQLQDEIVKQFNNKDVLYTFEENIRGSFNKYIEEYKKYNEELAKTGNQNLPKPDVTGLQNAVSNAINELERLGIASEADAEKMRQLASSGNLEDFNAFINKLREMGGAAEEFAQKLQQTAAVKVSNNLTGIGAALNVVANAMDKSSSAGRVFAGVMMSAGGALKAFGEINKYLATPGAAFPWLAVAMAAITVVNGLATAIETDTEKLERLQKQAEGLSNTAKEIKADEKTLQSGINKVEELKVKRYESAEAANEYQAAVEDLAEKFPELILGFDEAGNTILDLESAEDALAEARKKTLQATYDAAVAESEAKQQEVENAKEQIKTLRKNYSGESLRGVYGSNSDNDSITRNVANNLSSLGAVSGAVYSSSYAQQLLEGKLSINDLLSEEKIFELAVDLNNFYNGFISNAVDITNLEELKDAINNLPESFNTDIAEELIYNLEQINDGVNQNIQSDLDIVVSFAARLEEIDFSSEEGREEYNNFKKAYNALDEETQEYINGQIFNVEELIRDIDQTVSFSNQSKGINNSLISSYLQLTKANEKGWEFLEESNQARLLLTNQLTETWMNSDEYKNKTWEEFKSSDEFENAVNEFYEAYNQLGEDKQKLLEEIETDTRSYTAQDVKRMLGIGDDENNPINKYIDSLYKTAEESKKQVEDIFKEYDTHDFVWSKNILELNPLNALQQGLSEVREGLDFPPEIISFINARAKEINQLTKNGFIQSAQRLSDQTLTFLSTLYSESMEPQERATIMAILNSANLQTKEGIDEAIEQIQNSNVDDADQKAVIEQLETRKKELVDNVALSIRADLAQLVEGAEDDSKLLSKAGSGLSVKETNELIQQAQSWGVNLSLKDFIPNGDKLIASENAFNELQQGYQSKLKAAGDKAQENLDKAKSLGLYDGNNFSVPEFITEDQLRFFEQQLGGFSTDMANFVGEDTTQLSDAGRAKVEEIYKTIGDSLFEYGESIGILFQTIFGEANWNKGDYSSLVESSNLGTTTGRYEGSELVWENVLDVNEFNKYLTGELQYDAQADPNLKAAVEKARSGVSTLLSDLLSKGADGINISDYAESGIEASDFEQMKADFATIGKDGGMSYQEFVQKYAAWTGGTIEEINNFILQAIQQDNKTSEAAQRKAFSDLTITGNVITGTIEQIEALANSLGIEDFTTLYDKDSQGADGTYQIINEAVQTALDSLNIIEQSIPNQLKTFSDNLSKAADYITKGSNDTAAMQQFADEYAKALGGEAGDYSWKELFSWDSNAKAYTLSADAYKAYIQAQKDKLSKAGEVDEEVARTIEEARKQLASTVDIDNFLKAENREVGSQAYNKLADQMRDYYSTIYDSEALVNSIVEKRMQNILSGGNAAVQNLVYWVEKEGTEVSSSDVEQAYRAQISQLENAFDQLSYGVGSLISGQAVDILEAAGYGIDRIEGTDSAVIKSIGDVADAYEKYYDELKKTGEATVAALNEAYAKVLETRDDSDVISALGDAASMTYTRLGEILATKGLKLEEQVFDGIIESIGGGKVRITNFDRFATEIMGWTDIDKNSEEYVSAFKTYNDSLIALNRKAEKNIVEEIQSLENAKPGDQINLTQLFSELDNTTTALLTDKLSLVGATLNDGILTLEKDANILGIAQTLTQEAQENGLIMQDSMAKLADTVNKILSDYTDKIKNGIQGKLNNADVQSLQVQAQNLGFTGTINFKQTEEGLRLSKESTLELYNHLKSIDQLQAKIVFDELYDSVTKSDKNLKSMSGTLASITKIQQKIKDNEEKISVLRAEKNNAKADQIEQENNKLKEQLGLYEEIKERHVSNPDSYNFMNNDLPDTFKGAENYWNSVGSAFKAMNEAGETGYMSIQDFYNIVNEMSNLAVMSGEDLQFMGRTLKTDGTGAAELIEEGMSALSNVDGEGVAISLKKLGGSFANGAQDMQSGFQGGIKTMAESQIKVLDAQIAMLETLVAMEKIGDIDVNKNGIFDVADLFQTDENGNFIKNKNLTLYTKEFQQTANDIIEASKSNKDLEAGLEAFKINSISAKEMLEDATDGVKNLEISEEVYFAAMEAVVNAAKNGDFNPEDMSHFWEDIAEYIPDGYEFDMGNISMVFKGGVTTTINWEDPDIQALLKDYDGDTKNAREKIKQAVKDYDTNDKELNNLELKSALVAKGIIEINEKNGKIIFNGKEYDSDAFVTEDLVKAIIEDKIPNAENLEVKNENGKFSGTYQLGNREITITYSEGKILYHSDILNKDFDSQDELLKAEYDNYVTHAQIDGIELPSYEQWLYQKYGIITNTETTFKDSEGNEIKDPENNRDFKNAVQNFISKSDTAIDEYLNNPENFSNNKDGTYTLILINGSTISFAAENEKEAKEKAKEKAQEFADPLADSVAAGIKAAFANDPENTIGNVLITAITTALSKVSFDGQNFTISDIPVTAEKITVDTSKATTSIFGPITKETGDKAKAFVESKQSSLNIPNVNAKVDKVTYSAPTTIDSKAIVASAKVTGQDINAGLVEGMSDTTEVRKQALEVGSAVTNAINVAAGTTQPPSTITTQTGKNLVQGLIDGLTDGEATAEAVSEATSLAQQIIDAIQAYFNANPLSLSAGLNTPETPTPKKQSSASAAPTSAAPQTIAPVVDLSGITALQNAIAALSSAGTAAAAELGQVNANLINSTVKTTNFEDALSKISDSGKIKAEEFEQALSAIGDNGKKQADDFQTALSNIGDNGKKKADDFAAALDAIKQDGITNANNFKDAVNAVQSSGATNASNFKDAVNNTGSTGASNASSYKDAVNDTGSSGANNASAYRYAVNGTTEEGAEHAAAFKDAISNIGGTVSLGVDISVNVSGGAGAKGKLSRGRVPHGHSITQVNDTSAKWTQQHAYASGKTLMGELGPELVVSHGRYFLVGQNGPEMVNLDDDAIVFNHLQTQKLVQQGKVNTHGSPVTNERKATSMATGNFDGPAMASASEVLSILKQLREMWKSLRDASMRDLGISAGKAKDKDNDTGKDTTTKDTTEETKDDTETAENYVDGIESKVERWYNWLKAIEETQEEINKLTKEYTLMEKQGVSTEEQLANLTQQYAKRRENAETRQQLVEEQTAYRTNYINEANQGLMSAFYQADPETGQVYVANDDAFQKFLQAQQAKGMSVGALGGVLAESGYISQGTTIQRELTNNELERKADEDVKQKYSSQNEVPDYLQEYYEDGKLKEDQEDKAREAAKNKHKDEDRKDITLTRDIKTGADLMAELNATDDADNLVHSAADQLAILKEMGVFTEDLMANIDTSEDDWESQVMQRFYDKVDEDKTEIESLTESIRDQEEAALDDAIAMQEINEKIRNLVKPVTTVTKELTKWYNESKQIQKVQQEINKLTKEMTLLQGDQKINGAEIYTNLMDQAAATERQIALNEDLIKKRKQENKELQEKYSDLPISIDEETGLATFSENKIGAVNGQTSVTTSYRQVKRNELGYEVDVNGNYRDDKGVLRNSAGEKIDGNFGELATEVVQGATYDFSNKTLPQIIEDLNETDGSGKALYDDEQKYQILQAAGFGEYMRYDENGNEIYDGTGEMTKDQMTQAVNAGVSRLQNVVDEINTNNDEANNLEEENLKLLSDLNSIQQQLIDNQISVEKAVKDAIVQEHQDAIDTKKDLRDALEEASQNTIDGLNEALDDERSMYEENENETELASLQRQLAVAQMSGGSMSEIQSLQDQITTKQQEMYFTEREDLINKLDESMQRQIEDLDTQIGVMEASLQFQIENGLLWAEVNEILKQSPEAIISYITDHNTEFKQASDADRKQQLNTIGDQVTEFKAYQKDADEAAAQAAEQAAQDQESDLTDIYTVEGEIKDAIEDVETAIGDIDLGHEEEEVGVPEPEVQEEDENPVIETPVAEDSLGAGSQNEDQGIDNIGLPDESEITIVNPTDVPTIDLDIALEGGTSQETPQETPQSQQTSEPESQSQQTQSSDNANFVVKNPKTGKIKIVDESKLAELKKKGWKVLGKIPQGEGSIVPFTVERFAEGGDIDYTGPAWVDGSKNEPEHIFNFEQMNKLREHLLNGVDVTRRAVSGISDMVQQLPNANTYNNINNSGSDGTNIEKLEFRMEVKEIANDYDARRAGEQAMEEMVRVARKSGTRSLSRR